MYMYTYIEGVCTYTCISRFYLSHVTACKSFAHVHGIIYVYTCTCVLRFPFSIWTEPEWASPMKHDCMCILLYVYVNVFSILQFSIGWWFVIDACAERAEPLYAAFHICGIFSTIALLMWVYLHVHVHVHLLVWMFIVWHEHKIGFTDCLCVHCRCRHGSTYMNNHII